MSLPPMSRLPVRPAAIGIASATSVRWLSSTMARSVGSTRRAGGNRRHRLELDLRNLAGGDRTDQPGAVPDLDPGGMPDPGFSDAQRLGVVQTHNLDAWIGDLVGMIEQKQSIIRHAAPCCQGKGCGLSAADAPVMPCRRFFDLTTIRAGRANE